MILVDTHAHLQWPDFQSDLDQILKRANQADVELIINIGTDLATSQQAVDMAIKHSNFYATIGLHPHDGTAITTDQSLQTNIEALEKMYSKQPDKIVAVGECGLDFNFHSSSDFVPTDRTPEQLKIIQHQLYLAQIALAKKLGLPLVIHCRDAWEQIFVPELSGTRGVFHTFTGSAADAQKALNLGYYLSFSCIITYPKNEYLRQIIKDLPLDNILTETDCPFLPPQDLRGQRNEPAYITQVIKTIAEIRQQPISQIADAVYANTQRLFKLF